MAVDRKCRGRCAYRRYNAYLTKGEIIMATVKKINKSITIYLHNGDTYEVADGENGSLATAALYDFNNKDIVKVVGDDMETLIPFHSILKVEVTTSEEETEVEDTFCVNKVPEDVEP